MEEIEKDKWYSVNQIAKARFIFGLGFMGVRKLVETGQLSAARLKATNRSQVRYKIQGRHIIEYLNKNKPK
ncbi:hypothetical protein KAU51_04175 [Candidatus Parcubacteria bacterium]|nr:hypothetical protein [Candidatus Parcubacteria bacterium]